MGRERFETRYGRHYLVLSDPRLARGLSAFVNTASRDIQELLDGNDGRLGLEVLPLVPRKKKGDTVTLGRASECDLVLSHARVSGRHVEISRGGGLLLVTDLGSKNGTRLNGTKLA